jgi:hypothetical protein
MDVAVCFVVAVLARRIQQLSARYRHRYKLTSDQLAAPSASAWSVIRNRGLDSGYIIVTTLTVQAFNALYHSVYPAPAAVSVSGGRPTRLRRYDYFAMTLFYLHSVTNYHHIAMIFGCPPSTCHRQVSRTILLLSSALPSIPDAAIIWPDLATIRVYHNVIAAAVRRRRGRVDLIDGAVFGFLDGCNLPIERHVDLAMQHKFYNPYKQGEVVGNLFVWGPDGCIIHAYYNAPGVIHDSVLAYDSYELMESVPAPYALVADHAFQSSGVRIICTSTAQASSRDCGEQERSRQVASLRVAAEWGNSALQLAYMRLTIPLPANADYRYAILRCCLHLHNYRTRTVEINQIRTVYRSDWCGNWRHTRQQPSSQERYVERQRVRYEERQQRQQQQQQSRQQRNQQP